MRRLAVSTTLLALAGAACAPSSTSPTAPASSSLGILEVPIGTAHVQFDEAAVETAYAGMVALGAPNVGNALSDIFYDYSVQLDASSKRVIAVSASRVLTSRQECQQQFERVVSAVRSTHPFDTENRESIASLETNSGALTIRVNCHGLSGSKHPSLSLAIFDKALASEATKTAAARTGR